jgi:hypothetical protein
MNAVVITTNQGEKYISLTIHQSTSGALLLDYYKDAYSARIMNLKDACSEVGIDFDTFVNEKANEAELEIEAMRELYGEGDEVESAKERYGLFCAMI